MKKVYSTIIMLTMMVAALSFTACSSSGDEVKIDGNTSFLVGTWSLTSSQGWGRTIDDMHEYFQFKSNGTYINVQFDNGLYISKGNWKATDTELILQETEGKLKSTFTYTIVSLTQSTLTFAMWGISVNAVKVPDSTIDKYIN